MNLNDAKIRIFYLPGDEVMAISNVKGFHTPDISSFYKGIFLVKVLQDHEVTVFKLVVL